MSQVTTTPVKIDNPFRYGGIMEDNRVLLGMRLKELRKVKQLSQEELSDKIGISPKHLSRLEMGRGFPSLETLEKIAAILNVELKEFFDFDAYKVDLISKDSIMQMFEHLDDTKKRLIYKFIKSMA